MIGGWRVCWRGREQTDKISEADKIIQIKGVLGFEVHLQRPPKFGIAG